MFTFYANSRISAVLAMWLLFGVLNSPSAFSNGLDVPYTFTPPQIDGKVGFGEWHGATIVPLDSGFIALAHDGFRMYVLIDMLDDDGDDPFIDDGRDQFWLLFDVDEDSELSSGIDLRYRLSSDFGNMRYQTYCSGCSDNYNLLSTQTYSSRAEGFGCFIGDLSATFLPLSCSPHRVWEIAIDFQEIEADDKHTRWGYRVTSGLPEIIEQSPADHLDAANYMDLNFVGTPRRLAAMSPGVLDLQFEVTQAIQTPENELDLAAGKPTAVRIWNETINDSTFRNYIYGTVEGKDLPGSPLLDVSVLSSFFRGNPRHLTSFNSLTPLPGAWAEAGTVHFGIIVQNLDYTVADTFNAAIDFVPTLRPVFWTVSVNYQNEEGVDVVPDPAWITQNEEALRKIAPIREIEIVRRPPLALGPFMDRAELIEALNQYDLQSLLVWSFMAFLTGEPGYPLPDQITGFLGSVGLGAGGSSDPAWNDQGRARVTWVSRDALQEILVYAHELNHNLDTDPTGTWGRHSRGCFGLSGLSGTDEQWPYGSDFSIQDVGVIQDGPAFKSVSELTPDLMSYCEAESPPDVWMSPYRWSAWLNLFRDNSASVGGLPSAAPDHAHARVALPEVTLSTIEDSYYILGRIYPDGSGELRQIIRHPGQPSQFPNGGEYSVSVLDCSDAVIDQANISPGFVDVEYEPLAFSSFVIVLAAPPEACSIVLKRNQQVLAHRAVSNNAPWVDLLTPNGGETWDGIETISWDAGDPDEDDLTFSILYSPDNGSEWHSVVSGLSGRSYDVDTNNLIGSDEAVIRVLVSDGARTSHDQSDEPFEVAASDARLVIVTPADGSVHDANNPLELSGYAQDALGFTIRGANLAWRANGTPVGTGDSLSVNLAEGEHLVELLLLADDAVAASVAVNVTMSRLSGHADPIENLPGAIDIISVDSFISGEDLVCEFVVNSGASRLIPRSHFTCHIDFDDVEEEAASGCDADSSGSLGGPYQLGSNGQCSTSDMGLNYRHTNNGGECTGGPEVSCVTEEFSGEGTMDTDCDGSVGALDAVSCRIRIFLPLAVIRDNRDEQCFVDDCLGGVNEFTGEYRAFHYYESKLRGLRDRVPDTDDNGTPNSHSEVFYLNLR